MNELKITISGQTGTGKSTIATLLEEFLIKEGFDVEMDLDTELRDYGTERKFRELMLANRSEREYAVREKSLITINQAQTPRNLK